MEFISISGDTGDAATTVSIRFYGTLSYFGETGIHEIPMSPLRNGPRTAALHHLYIFLNLVQDVKKECRVSVS